MKVRYRPSIKVKATFILALILIVIAIVFITSSSLDRNNQAHDGNQAELDFSNKSDIQQASKELNEMDIESANENYIHKINQTTDRTND